MDLYHMTVLEDILLDFNELVSENRAENAKGSIEPYNHQGTTQLTRLSGTSTPWNLVGKNGARS